MTKINPPPAKAITNPIIAYVRACLPFEIFSGLPADVTKRMPAQTSIKTATLPITINTKFIILVIRSVKLQIQVGLEVQGAGGGGMGLRHKGLGSVTPAAKAELVIPAKVISSTKKSNFLFTPHQTSLFYEISVNFINFSRCLYSPQTYFVLHEFYVFKTKCKNSLWCGGKLFFYK